MSTKSRWLRPNRVAEFLDCSPKHVWELVSQGQLEAIRLGPRAMRISEVSVMGFLEKMRIKAME